MIEKEEIQQWWEDIQGPLWSVVDSAFFHGVRYTGRTDGNEVVERACAELASLRTQVATLTENLRVSNEKWRLQFEYAQLKEREVATLTAERDRAERVLAIFIEQSRFLSASNRLLSPGACISIEKFGDDAPWLRSRVEGEG